MNNLKDLREKAGLTQEMLAIKVKKTKASISNYETGFRTPTIKDAQKIAIAISDAGIACSVDDLFPLQQAS